MKINLDEGIVITLWKESDKKKHKDEAIIKVERIDIENLDFQTLIAPQPVKRKKIGSFFEGKVYDEVFGFFEYNIAPKLKEIATTIFNQWDTIKSEQKEESDEISFDIEKPTLYPAFGMVDQNGVFAMVESGYAMTT